MTQASHEKGKLIVRNKYEVNDFINTYRCYLTEEEVLSFRNLGYKVTKL